MRKLNVLHNNAKSDTRPVPLLTTTSSQMKRLSLPVALPQSGQPRSKTTEAARRAAQSVYSDDFGDIDDISLFDEPTTHRPTTRPSPPQEKESDLFATDFGDMLDDFSPANKKSALSREAKTVQDNHAKGSSLYDVDEDMLLPLEQALDEGRHSYLPKTQQGAGNSAGPFLETFGESAILSLGSRATVQGSSSAMVKTPSFYSSAMPEGHALSHDNAFNGAFEERPTSSDSAMKACMEELGTDFFNYTG
jgi:hypothetical protein